MHKKSFRPQNHSLWPTSNWFYLFVNRSEGKGRYISRSGIGSSFIFQFLPEYGSISMIEVLVEGALVIAFLGRFRILTFNIGGMQIIFEVYVLFQTTKSKLHPNDAVHFRFFLSSLHRYGKFICSVASVANCQNKTHERLYFAFALLISILYLVVQIKVISLDCVIV